MSKHDVVSCCDPSCKSSTCAAVIYDAHAATVSSRTHFKDYFLYGTHSKHNAAVVTVVHVGDRSPCVETSLNELIKR